MKIIQYILVLIGVIIGLCSCTTSQKPLCRHIVLAQYAAFKDAGYETEIWHMQNNDPEESGFKYHVAVRVKVDGQWEWVTQPSIVFTTVTTQPRGTELLRKIEFSEVSGWIQNTNTGVNNGN